MATAKPRARRKASGVAGNPAAKLIEALQFVAMAQDKAGPVGTQFCMLRNNWVAASNGVLTIGAKIEEDLEVCPHTLQFLDALTKATVEQTIAQDSPAVLSVQGGAFRGLVACAEPELVYVPPPDPAIAPCDARLVASMDHVQMLATDNAPEAMKAAVLVQAWTCVATNGHVLLEHAHGIDMPPNLLVPKKSVQAIVKCKKIPTAFGYSQSSLTIWFEDGSFIKTQLFNEQYVNYRNMFPEKPNAWPLPNGFFSAVHAIASFSENNVVYFDKGVMSSHIHETRASTYKVEGLKEDMAFNAAYLLMCELDFKTADFQPEKGRVIFYGDESRGVIMGIDMSEARRRREAMQSQTRRVVTEAAKTHFAVGDDRKPLTAFDDMDDDIPF
jgi:hypothetical protein